MRKPTDDVWRTLWRGLTKRCTGPRYGRNTPRVASVTTRSRRAARATHYARLRLERAYCSARCHSREQGFDDSRLRLRARLDSRTRHLLDVDHCGVALATEAEVLGVMLEPDTIQRVREAALAITHAAECVDRLKDREPVESRGTPGSRRRELTNIARRLEGERSKLEWLYG
jgi:hypothetical protein